MKKHFLFLAMAVAAMTSCMKDEVIATYEPTPQAIGFESFVNKATKAIGSTATPTKDAGLNKFYVHGNYGSAAPFSEVFNEVTVTKVVDGENISWDYAGNDKYWTTNTYNFAAYAQGDDDDAPANVTLNGNSFSITNVTIPYTTAAATKTTSNAKDLVADLVQTTGTMQRTETVPFTFKHLLSKVKFTVQNTDPKFTMNITDLTIAGVKYNGSFASATAASWTPTSGMWTPSGEGLTNFIPVAATSNIAVAATLFSDELLVMPQALGSVTFSITADFYDGSDKVDTKTVSGTLSRTGNTSWEPNNSYNYTISLPSAAKPIVIGTVGVNTWGADTVIELND